MKPVSDPAATIAPVVDPKTPRMLKTIKFIHDAEHFIVEGPYREGTLEVWKMNDDAGSDGKLQGDTVCKFPLDGDYHGAVTDIVETEDAIYVGIAE